MNPLEKCRIELQTMRNNEAGWRANINALKAEIAGLNSYRKIQAARIDYLDTQAHGLYGHLLTWSHQIGAKDGDDMIDFLYSHFNRVRCECGHSADEHHQVELSAETNCGHSDPNYGYCECNGLKLVLYSQPLVDICAKL